MRLQVFVSQFTFRKMFLNILSSLKNISAIVRVSTGTKENFQNFHGPKCYPKLVILSEKCLFMTNDIIIKRISSNVTLQFYFYWFIQYNDRLNACGYFLFPHS